MAADHAWSGLKPSRARAVDAGGRSDHYHHPHQAGSSSLRGSEWAPSWAPTLNATDESWMSPWSGAVPGHGAPTSLPGALARRKGLAVDLSMSLGGRGAGGSAAGFRVPGQSLQQQPLPHREGWKRSLTSSSRWGTDRRLYRFGSPCSETKLDAEMAVFESEITRTVSDHLSSLISLIQASPSPTQNSGSSAVAAASSLGLRPSLGFLKRKRSGFPETHDDVQGDCGWIPPLKLVVRKGLTLSDVGELNRIIIPKKDAESLSFPQIDTKEGAVLQMEDYCALKRWHFRFKYWTNNKSRMYVLENTGDFVRYHSLSEHDVFIVYEDVCKNLLPGIEIYLSKYIKAVACHSRQDFYSNILDQVVCGQKKIRDDNLLDDSKVSAPETPPASATKDISGSRTTDIANKPAPSG